MNELLKEVLKKEGAASIVSWTPSGAHIANTWQSYITILDDETLVLPAAGMMQTEENVHENNNVKLVVATKELTGLYGPGAGFLLECVATFEHTGDNLELVKKIVASANRALVLKITKATQTV